MRVPTMLWPALAVLANGLLLFGLHVRVERPGHRLQRPAAPPPPPPVAAGRSSPDRLSPIVLEVSRRAPLPSIELQLLPQFRVRLRVNQSSAAALAAIPGFSARTAEAIVAHRRLHGPYRLRAELLDVPGIGWNTYLRLLSFVSLDRMASLDVDAPDP
jgi:helix-hairpin-helix protein